MFNIFQGLGHEASILLALAIILCAGFLVTRLTKLARLPNVSGYILAGILIGPHLLNLIPQEIADGMGFVADIALAFIAFGVGKFFRREVNRKAGMRVVVITLLESLLAGILITLSMLYIFHVDWELSLLLGGIATATAPASTLMTINQYHARGDFVNTLLQVVALDDVVCLILYSVAVSVADAVFSSSGFQIAQVLLPIGKNLLLLLLGCFFGILLKLLISRRSNDNRLIVAIALLFSYCGICAVLDVSPLLGCMGMGMVYINTTEDERLFRQLNYFSPPILLLFFFRSGLSFDLGLLVNNSEAIGSVSLLLIGIIYFIVRIAGKYLGAFAGCKLAGKSPKVSRYLGLALIPQAGVAIGLAALGARELSGELGRALETIILSSSVLYELIGPGAAKLSLYLSGSYSNELEDLAPVEETTEDGQKKTEVDLLIERIQKIQSELPAHTENENERAFTEAAEEYYHDQNIPAPRRNPRRRIL